MMNFHEARKNFAEQVLQTGGATLRAVRNEKGIQGFDLAPETGYMVSYKLTENRDFLVVNIDDDENMTRTWAGWLFDKLLDVMLDAEYIGAWVDQGSLIGDYSKHFDTLADAIAFGKANEQAAIYDLANKTSIYI